MFFARKTVQTFLTNAAARNISTTSKSASNGNVTSLYLTFKDRCLRMLGLENERKVIKVIEQSGDSNNVKSKLGCPNLFRAMNEFIGNKDFIFFEDIESEFMVKIHSYTSQLSEDWETMNDKDRKKILDDFEKIFANKTAEFIQQELGSNRLQPTKFSTDHLAMLTRFFILNGKHEMAAECIWTIAAFSLKNYGKEKFGGLEFDHHRLLYTLAAKLSIQISTYFRAASDVHSKGYYKGLNDAFDLETALNSVLEFPGLLKKLDLSDEKKQEIEKQMKDLMLAMEEKLTKTKLDELRKDESNLPLIEKMEMASKEYKETSLQLKEKARKLKKKDKLETNAKK